MTYIPIFERKKISQLIFEVECKVEYIILFCDNCYEIEKG